MGKKKDCYLVKIAILFWKRCSVLIEKTHRGVHRLFRGVHFERLGALTNRNLDRTKYLFYNIDLFVLRPRILLNYRKEQGLMH